MPDSSTEQTSVQSYANDFIERVCSEPNINNIEISDVHLNELKIQYQELLSEYENLKQTLPAEIVQIYTELYTRIPQLNALEFGRAVVLLRIPFLNMLAVDEILNTQQTLMKAYSEINFFLGFVTYPQLLSYVITNQDRNSSSQAINESVKRFFDTVNVNLRFMNSPAMLTNDPTNSTEDQLTSFGHIILIATDKNSIPHSKKFILYEAIQIAWNMWTDTLNLKYNIPIENPDDILEDILSNSIFHEEDSPIIH